MGKISVLKKGMTAIAEKPAFGSQHKGISPGGAHDAYSMNIGNILLGNPLDTSVLEITMAGPHLQFEDKTLFVLSGAPFHTTLNQNLLNNAEVYLAEPGDELVFNNPNYGLRIYLCCAGGVSQLNGKELTTGNFPVQGESIVGRKRGKLLHIATWLDPEFKIRIVRGPEYRLLKNPETLVEQPWNVTNDVSAMGIKCNGPKLEALSYNIPSEAVADGTIQITNDGLIVLLKGRQTIGGYPRVANVISADMDSLGQVGPGNAMQFKMVEMGEALSLLNEKNESLEKFKTKFN